MRALASAGRFEDERGAEACQIAVEDTVGLMRQLQAVERERSERDS